MNEFYRMNQLIGSEADWASSDLVIGLGEIALAVMDAGGIRGKIGDGSSKFSELDYVIGTASVPLTGTEDGQPITGNLIFENTNINREYVIGILEGLGVDNLVIGASGGNQAASAIWVTINSNNWIFDNDGKLKGMDVTFDAGDDLTYVNKQYVDTAVAGGVSGSYIPLTGTAGNKVTGRIQYRSDAINKDYTFGIIEGFGVDNLVLQSDGANALNCSYGISMNNYNYWFMNTGRLLIPDITYGVGDDLAAANKKYVDSKIVQLEAKLAAAGIAL